MRRALPALPVEGGCVCGAVRYRLSGRPRTLYACYCHDCQRFSGGAHSMSMPVAAADVTLLAGETARYDKTADSGRIVAVHFCARCATRLWHAPSRSPDVLNLKPGTLDDTSWIVPVAHVWTASRQAGAAIPAGALSYEGQQPDHAAMEAAFEAAFS
jgi:hypothetical protein